MHKYLHKMERSEGIRKQKGEGVRLSTEANLNIRELVTQSVKRHDMTIQPRALETHKHNWLLEMRRAKKTGKEGGGRQGD